MRELGVRGYLGGYTIFDRLAKTSTPVGEGGGGPSFETPSRHQAQVD